MNMKTTYRIAVTGLLAALLTVSKFAMDGLPNIELVSLLVIVYTLEFPKIVIPAVYTYAVLYGLLNGMGIWWVPQLYVWLVLIGLTRLMRQNQSRLVWALISGLFGLSYGALYAVFYGVLNGPAAGVAWWITGIPFDLLHGGGNFLVAMLLLPSLRKGIQRAKAAVRFPV